MRSGFVHEATVELGDGADERAIGAAVTVELCGHWEHDGPCHWPHHTSVDGRSNRSTRIRTVFASTPEDEQPVRERIARALRSGQLDGPSGVSGWTVVSHGAGELRPPEAELAGRWAGP